MKRLILAVMFVVLYAVSSNAVVLFSQPGWFVVTYNGDVVSGPYTYIGDCSRVAQAMQKNDFRVSGVCRYIN